MPDLAFRRNLYCPTVNLEYNRTLMNLLFSDPSTRHCVLVSRAVDSFLMY